MLRLIIKNQNKLLFNFLFLIIFLVLSVYFYKSFFSMLGNKWAFWELFVNYEGGFMKRGILGEIFINLNKSFGISPFSFFSPACVQIFPLTKEFPDHHQYLYLSKFEIPTYIASSVREIAIHS